MSQTPLHSAPRCCLCFDFQLKSIFETVSVITQVFTTPHTEIERGLGGDLYTGVDAHTHRAALSNSWEIELQTERANNKACRTL
jgi:hypothetical protein